MSTAHVRGATASRTLRQSNGGWLRPAPTLAALTLTSALLVGCTSSGEATGEQSATSVGCVLIRQLASLLQTFPTAP